MGHLNNYIRFGVSSEFMLRVKAVKPWGVTQSSKYMALNPRRSKPLVITMISPDGDPGEEGVSLKACWCSMSNIFICANWTYRVVIDCGEEYDLMIRARLGCFGPLNFTLEHPRFHLKRIKFNPCPGHDLGGRWCVLIFSSRPSSHNSIQSASKDGQTDDMQGVNAIKVIKFFAAHDVRNAVGGPLIKYDLLAYVKKPFLFPHHAEQGPVQVVWS